MSTAAQNFSPVGVGDAKPQTPNAARFILQDPQAFDQATQPALRSTWDLSTEPTAGMSRDNARQLWGSMNLEPEQVQEAQMERQRLMARVDQLSQEAVQLKDQLADAMDNRLSHPLVYAGAVGLIGLSALCWLQRRKLLNIQNKKQEIGSQAVEIPKVNAADKSDQDSDQRSDYRDEYSVFSINHETELTEDVVERKVDISVQALANSLSTKNYSTHLPLEALMSKSKDKPRPGLIAASKRLFDKTMRRPNQQNSLFAGQSTQGHDSHLSRQHAVLSTLIQDEQSAQSTQLTQPEDSWPYELPAPSSSSALATHLQQKSVQANIDLLTKTSPAANRDQDTVEHLLELRTAVSGLCVLGRPKAAVNLLLEHIESRPDTCAWAYLEFMRLCEQLGERQAFESLRQRYRQEFNRMAPYWQEPNANVIGLDGYARAAHELCTSWAKGREQAKAVLSNWLAGPMIGRKIMQLPAYHDLFDLYELLEYLEKLEQAQLEEFKPDSSLSNTPQALVNLRSLDIENGDMQFVDTVSLLELDYEFSSDVTLHEGEVADSETAVTIVKPGHFSVDINVSATQLGGLPSLPPQLDTK
jgi:hypothetical protein